MQGKESEAEGDYEKAIQFFEQILQIDPTNHLAKLRLISNYLKIGDSEKANNLQNEIDSSLEKAEKISNEDLKINTILDSLIEDNKNSKLMEVDELENIASSLIENIDGELQEVKKTFSQKMKNPQPIIAYPKSEVILEEGKYKDKREVIDEKYQQVLQIFKSKQYKQALIQLKEILKLNRKFDPAWFLIGLIYAKVEDFQKSLIYLQRAVELNPKNDQYFIWLSYVFAKLNFFTKSLEAAKQAINLNVENTSGWQNMGVAYKTLNEPRKALWCFIQANSFKEDEYISNQIKELKLQNIEPFNPYEKESKLCQKCGGEVRLTAKFCDNCGASLEISEEKKAQDESIKQCLICKQNIVKEKPVICKSCYFSFHRQCLLRWVEIHKRCPNCSGEVGWI